MRALVPAMLVAAAAATASASPVRVLFMGVKAGDGMKNDTVATIEQTMLASLDRAAHFSVVGRGDVKHLLTLEQQKQMAGCTDNQCMTELSGALGVPYVAYANVGRLGPNIILTVTLMDVGSATAVGRGRETFTSDAELPEAADRAAVEVARALANFRGETFDYDDRGRPVAPKGASPYVQLLVLPAYLGGEIGLGAGWGGHWQAGLHLAHTLAIPGLVNTYLNIVSARLAGTIHLNPSLVLQLGARVSYDAVHNVPLYLDGRSFIFSFDPSIVWFLWSSVGLVLDIGVGYATPFHVCSEGHSDPAHCMSIGPLVATFGLGAQAEFGL